MGDFALCLALTGAVLAAILLQRRSAYRRGFTHGVSWSRSRVFKSVHHIHTEPKCLQCDFTTLDERVVDAPDRSWLGWPPIALAFRTLLSETHQLERRKI